MLDTWHTPKCKSPDHYGGTLARLRTETHHNKRKVKKVDTMRTDKNKTFEILSGYVMQNNHINIEWLADQIMLYTDNERRFYEERFNTRRKTRNIAINELMYFINSELKYSGYVGYYATNKQVMDFDREHAGDLEKVLDILEQNVIETRKNK